MSELEDRNLWFANLAMQMGFIDQGQLAEAVRNWSSSPNLSLAEVLQRNGAISFSQLNSIAQLTLERLKTKVDPRNAPTVPLPPNRFRKTSHVLGKGGMGVVTKATDAELHRDVALKEATIDEMPPYRDEIVRRFIFEAEVTGRLEHPGIVPVYGFGRDGDNNPYYAMRIIRGETLMVAIRRFHQESRKIEWDQRRKSLEFRRLLRCFVQICETVAYAHQRGVLHLDIKPSNIMLGPFGETLLLDWGLAGMAPSPVTTDKSHLSPLQLHNQIPQSGSGGTPGYMAPEQRPGIGEIGVWTDIYLLGGTLFHIVEGRSPHGEAAPTLQKESTENASTPGVGSTSYLEEQKWSSTFDPLRDIFRKALSKKPADRHKSAVELAAAVEAFLADEPMLAYRAYVSTLQQIADQEQDSSHTREQLARGRSTLGHILEGMWRLDESLTEHLSAIDEFQKCISRNATSVRLRAELITCRAHVARVLDLLGRTSEAVKMRKIAKEEYRATLDSPSAPNEIYDTLMPLQALPNITFSSELAKEAGTRPKQSSDEDTLGHASLSNVASSDQVFQETAYYVEERIGSGGLADVYRARDENLGRHVAIKVVRENSDPDFGSLIAREGQVLAKLEHPGIIPVYSLAKWKDNEVSLVMRLIDGQPLDEFAKPYAAPGPDLYSRLAQLMVIFSTACRTIEAAHQTGFLHCDIKPRNIVVDRFKHSYVVDWSLALDLKPLESSRGGVVSTITEEGSVFGTPAYMSPEQARGDARLLDRQTDVFGLGATLFTILTGEGIRKAEDLKEMLDDARQGRVRKIESIRKDIPPALSHACARATSFNPTHRYPTAARLAEDIEAWVYGKPNSDQTKGWFGGLASMFAKKPFTF